MTDTLKIAYIKAQWHANIVDRSHEGFVASMAESGVAHSVDTFDVPGAFEMPLLAQSLAETGGYDAIVAAAFVVDGGIYRHDFVASAVVTGLMQAQLKTGVPMFSVSLTPHHYQETEVHTAFFREHFVKKGAEAAQAVLRIAALTKARKTRPQAVAAR
jgi:6,7-dimethyl-8-ribityllumazine synthase